MGARGDDEHDRVLARLPLRYSAIVTAPYLALAGADDAAAALGWGLERAVASIVALEPDLPKPGKSIGVKFTQFAAKE